MLIPIYTQRFLGDWKGKFEIGPNIILATSNAFVNLVIDMETCGFGPSSFPGERGHEVGWSFATCKK